MNLPVQTDERQPEQHNQVPDEWFVLNQEKSGSRFGQAAEFVIHAGCLEEAEKNKLAMAGLFILLFLLSWQLSGPFYRPIVSYANR